MNLPTIVMLRLQTMKVMNPPVTLRTPTKKTTVMMRALTKKVTNLLATVMLGAQTMKAMSPLVILRVLTFLVMNPPAMLKAQSGEEDKDINNTPEVAA